MGNTNKSKYSIDAVGEKYDFSDLTETPASTTNTTLNRLREAGLVEMVGKQRALTPYGRQIAQGL